MTVTEFERLLLMEVRKVREVLQRIDTGVRDLTRVLKVPRDEDVN